MNEKPKVLSFQAQLDIETVMTLFSGDKMVARNSGLTFYPPHYLPRSQNSILLPLTLEHVYSWTNHCSRGCLTLWLVTVENISPSPRLQGRGGGGRSPRKTWLVFGPWKTLVRQKLKAASAISESSHLICTQDTQLMSYFNKWMNACVRKIQFMMYSKHRNDLSVSKLPDVNYIHSCNNCLLRPTIGQGLF